MLRDSTPLLLYIPAAVPLMLAALLELPMKPAVLAASAVILAGFGLQRFTGSWLLVRPQVEDDGA
jgi:hypothetical protein